MRITKEQLLQLQEKIKGGEAKAETKPSKYKNIRWTVDGITFASKAEASFYVELKNMQKSGLVSWFVRQPRFDLPGKIIYIADFLVVYADGKIEVVDVKGVETETFRLKKRLLAECYPFELKVV